MVKISESLSEGGNNIKRILIGSGVSIIITIIGLIIFASLLTYTSIAENAIPTVTIIITVISILIGSSVSMSNVRKNGIINGSIVGLIYILTIYILSSLIEGSFSLNTYSIIMIIGSVLAGALGGIIGVNRRWIVLLGTCLKSMKYEVWSERLEVWNLGKAYEGYT